MKNSILLLVVQIQSFQLITLNDYEVKDNNI